MLYLVKYPPRVLIYGLDALGITWTTGLTVGEGDQCDQIGRFIGLWATF